MPKSLLALSILIGQNLVAASIAADAAACTAHDQKACRRLDAIVHKSKDIAKRSAVLAITQDESLLDFVRVRQSEPESLRALANSRLRGMQEPDWKHAESLGTPEAFIAFARKHTTGPWTEEANQRPEKIAWQAASAAASVEAIDTFLEKFPKSRYLATAKAERDKLRWERAAATHTLPSYYRYLKDEAEGQFANVARREIDKGSALLRRPMTADELAGMKTLLDGLLAPFTFDDVYKGTLARPTPGLGGTNMRQDLSGNGEGHFFVETSNTVMNQWTRQSPRGPRSLRVWGGGPALALNETRSILRLDRFDAARVAARSSDVAFDEVWLVADSPDLVLRYLRSAGSWYDCSLLPELPPPGALQ